MLAHLLDATITIERSTGLDRYGNPAATEPVTLAARVEQVQRTVVNTEGEQVATDTRITTLEAVLPTDLIVLDGRRRRIASIEHGKRPHGSGFWTVHL